MLSSTRPTSPLVGIWDAYTQAKKRQQEESVLIQDTCSNPQCVYEKGVWDDSKTGTRVCHDCGETYDRIVLDRTAEWNNHSDDDEPAFNKELKNRVGETEYSYLGPTEGGETILSGTQLASGKMKHGPSYKIQNRVCPISKNSDYYNQFKQIQPLLAKIGFQNLGISVGSLFKTLYYTEEIWKGDRQYASDKSCPLATIFYYLETHDLLSQNKTSHKSKFKSSIHTLKDLYAFNSRLTRPEIYRAYQSILKKYHDRSSSASVSASAS